jgi:hypothetical protein
MNADHETDLPASYAGDEVPVVCPGVGIRTVPVLPILDIVILPNTVYPLSLRGEHLASPSSSKAAQHGDWRASPPTFRMR